MKKLLSFVFIICFLTIGYSQLLNNDKVDLYLNDSQSSLTLDLLFEEGQQVNYYIFGTGEKTNNSPKIKGFVETVNGNTSITIDLSALTSGAYFIELGMPYKGRVYRQIFNAN